MWLLVAGDGLDFVTNFRIGEGDDINTNTLFAFWWTVPMAFTTISVASHTYDADWIFCKSKECLPLLLIVFVIPSFLLLFNFLALFKW